MKIVTPALLLTGALVLAACNQTALAPAPASTGVMAGNSSTGCKGEIDRYRAVMSNDLAMGHVNQSVYTRVDRELAQAEGACTAGREAEALRMVNATKARHGYL
jgi:hypothetical protein